MICAKNSYSLGENCLDEKEEIVYIRKEKDSLELKGL
jgi:hypothetical protein